jgi:tetratricopeptide (TPR) repeat protein
VFELDMKQIGGILRAERKKLNKSLEQMADELKVGVTTLSSIERGIHNVSKEKWMDYAKALGMGKVLGIEDEVEKKLAVLRRKLKIVEDITSENPEEARKKLTTLNKEEKVESIGVLRPYVHYLKGKCYFAQKDWEMATKYFQFGINSMEKYPELDRTNIKSACYNSLSVMKHSQGCYQDALQLIQRALFSFVDSDNAQRLHLESILLLNESIYLDQLSLNEKALKSLKKLDEYVQQGNHQNHVRISVKIKMHTLHAYILTNMNMLEKALEYAEKGEQLARVNQDTSSLFSIWAQIGYTYFKMQKIKFAEEYILKALDLNINKKISTYQLLIALKYQGLIVIAKNDWDLAEQVVKNMLALCEEHSNKKEVIEVITCLASFYQKQERYVEAISLYYEAERLGKEYKLNSMKYTISIGLLHCFKNVGDYNKFKEYMDSFFHLEVVKGVEFETTNVPYVCL